MKEKLFLLIIVISFISCTRLSSEESYQTTIVTRESGKLIVEEDLLIYKRSKENYTGRYIKIHNSGKIKGVSYYLEGKREGSEREFYESGTVKSERYFVKGKKQGEERTYFLKGDIKSKTNYSENLKNGREKRYSEVKGDYTVTSYLDGEKNGREEEYSKGNLVRETEFAGSKKDGIEVFYNGGRVVEKRSYEAGKLSSYEKTEYFSTNKRISYFHQGELTAIEVYEGGRLVEKTPYKDQVKSGMGYIFKSNYPYEVVYSNGRVIEKRELFKKANYNINIKFSGPLPDRKYVLITSNSAVPRQGASERSERLKEKISWGDKFTYLGETKDFYKVSCYGGAAYIDKRYSTLRRFDFNKMAEKLKQLDDFIKVSPEASDIRTINHYIDPTSKKNDKGIRDSYGSRGEQAAIAYYTEDGVEKFRYIHDRQYIMVTEEDRKEDTISFKLPGDSRVYTTSKSEVTRKSYGGEVEKAIVLDKKNQNQGIFEKAGGIWELVSYSYINSGMDNGKASYKTPSGEYSIAYSVPFILFLSKKEDGNDTKANFGIRFSGGGYVHAIPYSKKQYTDLEGKLETVIKEGEKKLGIYPTTHKCVRNPQEHGKFLYEWLGVKRIRDGRYRIPEKTSIVISY